jgi:hypothetical protein
MAFMNILNCPQPPDIFFFIELPHEHRRMLHFVSLNEARLIGELNTMRGIVLNRPDKTPKQHDRIVYIVPLTEGTTLEEAVIVPARG